MSLCQKLQQNSFLLPLFESECVYLVNGWRYPQHFPGRVDQHVGLVPHFVVTISTETRGQSLIISKYNHFRLVNPFNTLLSSARTLASWIRIPLEA
jgi:hypothetical protein